MITHSMQNGNVYRSDGKETMIIGVMNKMETVRIDNDNVEDISSSFDLELGEYVEQSRTTRIEPLPPQPESDSDKLARLETENTNLKSRMTDLEMFAADIIAGGGV